MISSELPEVVGMSDRVYVMREALSPASYRPVILARKVS